MTTALTFNDVTLSPITYQNSPWIRSVELARALGYSSEKSVSNIYNRNQDEFSNDMSVVINLSTTDNPVPSRIFSLRGCHLVAMFARTPVAKAFRRWVLDVLDKLDAEQHAASSSPTPDDFTGTLSITPSTTEDRKPLRALVGSWARLSGLRLRLPPVVALGTATEAPIDPRQTSPDQSRLQRAAARQHDHGHRAPPASAARGLHLDHLPHQPPGQIAGRVAVGLAQLGTVYAVEPHSHSPPVWLPDAQAVTIVGRDHLAGLGRRWRGEQRPNCCR